MKWIRIFESHHTFPCNYVDSIGSITNVHIWKWYRQINQTLYWEKFPQEKCYCLYLDHTHLALVRFTWNCVLSIWAAKSNIQYLFSRWDREMCLVLVQSFRFASLLLSTTKANCMHTTFFRWNFRSLFLRQLFAFFSYSRYRCELFFFAWFFHHSVYAVNVYLCMIRRNSIEFLDSLVNRSTFCFWNCYHSLTNMKKKNLKSNLSEWMRESEREKKKKQKGKCAAPWCP